MSDWLADLPVAWLAVLVFGVTYFATALIYFAVLALASRERAVIFKAVSPGLLPPFGILLPSLWRLPLPRCRTISSAPMRRLIGRQARHKPPWCWLLISPESQKRVCAR